MKFCLRKLELCIINKLQDVEPVKPQIEQKGKQKKRKRVKELNLINSGKSMSFRAISRNTYYRLNSVRDPPPPWGYYNINYQLIDKSTPKKTMILGNSHSIKAIDTAQPPLREIKIHDKLKGSVEFKKQSPKKSIEKLQLLDNPHEMRFESINLPIIYSKIKNSPQHDFSKTKSRDFKDFTVNITPQLVTPNFEYLKRSLSKTGVDFKKSLSRPPIISPKKEKEINSNSIDIDSIDKYLRSMKRNSL